MRSFHVESCDFTDGLKQALAAGTLRAQPNCRAGRAELSSGEPVNAEFDFRQPEERLNINKLSALIISVESFESALEAFGG